MEPDKDIFEQWREKKDSQPWLANQWNYLTSWWKFDGQYMFRNFKTGIKNLRYWLPVIWRDRNWDYRYIFTILKHKLATQGKYIGEYGIHLDNWKDERDMMTCVRLIERLETEYYAMEYMDYEKVKYWFEPTDQEDCNTLESRQLEENFDDYFAKYPLIYKRVINGEGRLKIDDKNDKHRIASNIAHINHERARKLLFKILEQEIEKWWD